MSANLLQAACPETHMCTFERDMWFWCVFFFGAAKNTSHGAPRGPHGAPWGSASEIQKVLR